MVPMLGSGMADDALTVLVYSDDRNTRDEVRLALGRRPASDLPPVQFVDVATDWAVMDRVGRGDIDLAILDGEAVPAGGLGVCRTIKQEVFQSPPILMLIARPQDRWLAAWSRADGVVSHPLDPITTAAAAAELLRARVAAGGVAARS
jgi:DNA-binding response OmpR family regulator